MKRRKKFACFIPFDLGRYDNNNNIGNLLHGNYYRIVFPFLIARASEYVYHTVLRAHNTFIKVGLYLRNARRCTVVICTTQRVCMTAYAQRRR